MKQKGVPFGYYPHMNVVAIIPAKANSVRLPGKNLRPMLGKTLLVWAIETAKKSSMIDRIIVSTPDENIAKMAKEAGAEVPYLEPPEISAKGGSIERLMQYAVDWLKKNENYVPDALVLLQTTNPLRQPHHLDEAVSLFKKSGADCVSAVSPATATNHPYWMFMRDANGNVVTGTGGKLKDMPTRSQELPPCFIRNDICFVIRPENLRSEPPTLWGEKMELYLMDEIFNTDINTEEDWYVTENKLLRLLDRSASSSS